MGRRALNELFQQVTTTDGDITELLSRLAEEAGTKDVATDGYGVQADDGEAAYPLTPVPGEKYDYVVIFCDNESDYANLQTMLKITPRADYKSTAVAPVESFGIASSNRQSRSGPNMGLTVVIPSAGRADRVRTHKAIKADVLCVPECEADAYRRRGYGVEIVTHPDTVRGLPAKRQWIADRFGDVFMVDDDIRSFRQALAADLPTELSDDPTRGPRCGRGDATKRRRSWVPSFSGSRSSATRGCFGPSGRSCRLDTSTPPASVYGRVEAPVSHRRGGGGGFRAERDERLPPPLFVRGSAVRPQTGKDVRQPRWPGYAPDRGDGTTGHGNSPPAVRGGGGGEAG